MKLLLRLILTFFLGLNAFVLNADVTVKSIGRGAGAGSLGREQALADALRDAVRQGADWLPADATRDSKVNWISNNDVTSEIRGILSNHVMVVADSCYSGKLTRGVHIKELTPDYLSRIARKKARVVLSSGGLEPVADRGGNGQQHSVFASAFIGVLRENQGMLDGISLFSKIRQPVMLNSDQTPEYADIRKAGHDGGDFIFVRKK